MNSNSDKAIQHLLDWVENGNPMSDTEDNDLDDINGDGPTPNVSALSDDNDTTYNSYSHSKENIHFDLLDASMISAGEGPSRIEEAPMQLEEEEEVEVIHVIHAQDEDEDIIHVEEEDDIHDEDADEVIHVIHAHDDDSYDEDADYDEVEDDHDDDSDSSRSSDDNNENYDDVISAPPSPVPENDVAPPPPKKKKYKKKILTPKRFVSSIDKALDPNNYNKMTYPKTTSGGTEEEKLVGYLGPKANKRTEKICWTSTPPSTEGKQRLADVISGPMATLRYKDQFDDVRSIFDSIFDAEIMNRIVLCTNEKIKFNMELLKERFNFRDNRKNYLKKETDVIEIRALIGLFYFRGLLNHNNMSRKHLFRDEIGNALFAATMSRNRFIYLCAVLSFDTIEEKTEKWQYDRFTAIREVFSKVMRNSQKFVIPSEFLSIDETLYPMRTQVSLKQYNKSKPAKYGLLFRSINDARFPYTYNSMVYCAKPESGNGPYHVEKIEDYVQYLVNDTISRLPLKGRNISIDRLYSSVSLANWLLSHGITVVGTLQSNRIGIPNKLKSPVGREILSNTIHYEEKDKQLALCSYTVKTKSKGLKNVLLLTTMRPLMGVTKDDDHKKPAIYKLYDFTKGGTDIVDQKMGYYTSKAKSSRWSITAFYYIIDTVRVNSQTILALKKGKNPRKSDSFEFIFSLVKSLVMPHMQRRSLVGLQSSIVDKIRKFIPKVENPVVEQLYPKSGEGGVCETCNNSIKGVGYTEGRKKAVRGTSQCQKCGEKCCRKHLVQVCQKHKID